MIDPDKLDALRQRHAARTDAAAATAGQALDRAATVEMLADMDWLLEEAARLDRDNRRLANLVAEITEIVASSRQRQQRTVADALDELLDDDERHN